MLRNPMRYDVELMPLEYSVYCKGRLNVYIFYLMHVAEHRANLRNLIAASGTVTLFKSDPNEMVDFSSHVNLKFYG